MSGPERYCGCGADADALTDEAHAEGCPQRPSLRAALGLRPQPPVALGMTTAEVLAYVEAEGLDLLVHSPRQANVEILNADRPDHLAHWTVEAFDYDEPRLRGFGQGPSFLTALVFALQGIEREVMASVRAADEADPPSAQRGSTQPPPLPVVRGAKP